MFEVGEIVYPNSKSDSFYRITNAKNKVKIKVVEISEDRGMFLGKMIEGIYLGSTFWLGSSCFSLKENVIIDRDADCKIVKSKIIKGKDVYNLHEENSKHKILSIDKDRNVALCWDYSDGTTRFINLYKNGYLALEFGDMYV